MPTLQISTNAIIQRWLNTPVPNIGFPNATVDNIFGYDGGDDDDEYLVEDKEKHLEYCSGGWIAFSSDMSSAINDFISNGASILRSPGIGCGFNVDGGLSDWHVNTVPLELLFADMPVFSWNSCESSHNIYIPSDRTGNTLLGTPLNTITADDMHTIYAIIYERLRRNGVDVTNMELPLISVTLP